ncbi:DNA-binding SARP family transcriptional activator [Nocardioides aromaticivorans]|uniref:DNA-binding SARP family transcriptional activator n=1 Tax=Nocardioides aromaticivorans TaxID=200618 RepID=A0A7Y9ZEB0_9ACTN|nr:BTAD domain-containing putative transcriptional regulator [Nocardioides aromaticivorans]NYI43812.1 DNA-binding SARP family transcriptional activator [Nocardioides aromaticivorans]
MSALAVRVLGELTVDGFDTAVLDRKARGLLLLLALAGGRPVPLDAAVDALWGDTPPARPADQVAVLASRVRRLLGRDRVERTDGGYRLRADWTDLTELDAVVREAERRLGLGEVGAAASAARAALALLRGPVPEVRAEADWAAAEWAAATRLVQRARRVAAAALLEAGEWRDALELASADLVADPLDEQAARTAMRAHAAAGRPAQALTVYADLRATLADELGTDPAGETAALHTAILRGDLPVVRAAARVPALVGRDSQSAHLDSLVGRAAAERAPRVALVSGEAGIGKTTLLATWAAARRAAGDRVLVGTCRPLDRAAPLDVVLSAIAAHLKDGDGDRLLAGDAAVLAPLLGSAVPGTHSVDPALGPSVLYGAVTRVLGRIAGDRVVVVVVDDAHLAGPTLGDWLAYLARRPLPVVVVLGARPDEGPASPATDHVGLGPLDRAHVAALVGERRADELHARSGGHPLFLAELASVPSGELPESLVAAVTARCDDLGSAGDLVRTAAVLGGDLDIDLLAGVLGRSTLDVLTDAERAVRSGLLVEVSGHLRFRHDLVRTALVSGTTAGRAALLHREAGRALARRSDADPATVAEHARLGGDRALAAQWLRTAAARAAERFDHATAEDLLDQSLALAPDDTVLLARARVRIRRRRYREAEADALAATGAGPLRWEAAAWAAYFDRRFDEAASYADDGALSADDPGSRTRCLVASGRILHARGELGSAGERLDAALLDASGEDRLEAAAWRGVLHAHRSEVDQALALLRPATRPGVGVAHTPASLHALLFTGHTLAVAGRAQEALACFTDYTTEVERRDVPRFAGRGVNFSGWVLRNLGATSAGVDAHQQAAEDAVDGVVIPEVLVAALEDLAEERLRAGDADAAAALLDRARDTLVGDLVFGWRLAMKLQLLQAQLHLLRDEAASALTVAGDLAAAAAATGVPRYDACARLLVHRATHALGEPVDAAAAWRDLRAVEAAVGVEAWWWAGSTGAALGDPRWLARAEELAAGLASRAGAHGDVLRAEAGRSLDGWRSAARRPGAVRSR